MYKNDRMFRWMLLFCLAATIGSVIRPHDFEVWVFEIAPGLIGVGVMMAAHRRFRLSSLVVVAVGVHFAILAVAAHYTYGQMPLFAWLKDQFQLDRNYYDRVGHFMQGFTPALICRELLLRVEGMKRGKAMFFICICIPLALSAAWELLEWQFATRVYPAQAEDWLGLQGDVFDAQADMLMALVGAAVALVSLPRLHDKSIRRMVNGDCVDTEAQ